VKLLGRWAETMLADKNNDKKMCTGSMLGRKMKRCEIKCGASRRRGRRVYLTR
jgi:hypothetical protein